MEASQNDIFIQDMAMQAIKREEAQLEEQAAREQEKR